MKAFDRIWWTWEGKSAVGSETEARAILDYLVKVNCWLKEYGVKLELGA
ncbi:hypothetical protein [Paenibacillus tianmuensis]|nr:hypothetical protein [Paenibacillus tianmuensis]